MGALSNLFIQSIGIMLPVWAANIACNFLHFAKKHSRIRDISADFGKNFYDGKRLIGDGITWIGFLICLTVGWGVGLAQGHAFRGVILGLGVWIGGAVGSFVKRRFLLDRGEYFPVLDHSDYVIGAFAIYAFFYPFDISVALMSLLLTLVFHPFFCILGYRFGIKDNPW